MLFLFLTDQSNLYLHGKIQQQTTLTTRLFPSQFGNILPTVVLVFNAVLPEERKVTRI